MENTVIDMPATAVQIPTQTALALTPAALLTMAVQSGAPIEQMKELMAMQIAWERREAEKAFHKAFAAFKAEAVQIIKGKKITDGPLKGRFHAELSDAVNAATPALSKHGLSTSWRLTKDERDWMEVTCTLSHEAGHSESVSMGGAPDTGPGRNAIQARGSVKTYLERYTLTAILGLAAQDADDDGVAAGAETSEVDRWIALAQRTKSEPELNSVVAEGVNAFARDKRSYALFREAVTAHRLSLKGDSHA